MKKILLLTTACICTSWLSAQFIYKIKADSVLITNDSCTAELNLENSTRHVLGFLYNKGNGRTEFRRGAIKLNDSTYLIGADTIRTAGSASANYIWNQNSTDQAASFRISGSAIIKGGITSPTTPSLYNERFGYGALASFASTGLSNTAVGYNAMNAFNSTGSGNTAVGHGALALTTTSAEQTAIGSGALYNHTSGPGTNTAIGYVAMYGSTGASGYSNVAIGRSALLNYSSGHHNIAIGEYASSAVTTGSANINVGGGGLSADASYNVGVGIAALGSTSGTLNTAVGTQALTSLTSGSSNIGIGYYAGGSITTGNTNVFIGKQSGYTNNGSDNTLIGTLTGYNNTGSGNVFLGNNAGFYETSSNKLYIENTNTYTPLIYGDFANDTVRVNGKFHANGPVKMDLGSDATGDIFYRNSSGQFTRLGIGSSGKVLTVTSGLPSWETVSGGGGVSDGDKGDITVTSSGATWTIDNDAVTYGKMQNISATQRVLGRNTSGAGDAEEVTLSQLLDWVGSAAQGDILYRGSSGWNRLAAGTSGQVLQTNGSSADPSWVTPSSGFSVVKKTANENRSSTTTLTNDNTLTVALNAGTLYHIRGKIFLDVGNATMDYKYALAYSGTTTSIICKRIHVVAGATSGTGNEVAVAQNTIIPSTAVTATSSGIAYVEIDVMILTSTSGTFGFQWAQNTSNGSNLTVLAGSYLEYLQF